MPVTPADLDRHLRRAKYDVYVSAKSGKRLLVEAVAQSPSVELPSQCQFRKGVTPALVDHPGTNAVGRGSWVFSPAGHRQLSGFHEAHKRFEVVLED